jgi:catechol 2,3-dioxygenase
MTFGIAPPRYRLPNATRLGGITLQVADLGRSVDYYQRVLGLSVVDRDRDGATLSPEGDGQVLVRLRVKPGARRVPRRGRLGLYHFALLLPDRASLGRFVVHLSAIAAQAASSDHAVSEALYLWDADGLGIEVYADRPRSTWRLQGRELFMTVEPLDLEDLAQAGKGEPWTGMPAGTRVGHMHLHVGDLPSAEAFYHAALGLDKTAWGYPGALFLSAGGYHHHLGTNTWAAGAAPAGPDDARLMAWDVVVPTARDQAAVTASLESAGYRVTTDEGALVVQDPWGTTLRLLAA